MTEGSEYSVEGSDEYFDGFIALPDGHQRRVQRFVDLHLRHTPSDPTAGMKALRGQQLGLYQFMISASHGTRLLYRIDEQEKIVRLQYCGTHPSWSNTRRGGNIQNL